MAILVLPRFHYLTSTSPNPTNRPRTGPHCSSVAVASMPKKRARIESSAGRDTGAAVLGSSTTSASTITPVSQPRPGVGRLFRSTCSTAEFSPLNADKSPFQRTFVNQVKRCAEMSRKLRFFKDQIHKAGLMSAPRPILQPEMELEQLVILLAEYEHELLEMNNSEQL